MTPCPQYGPRYDWSPLQQSILLASGFAGSTVIILPLGILLDRFGHVRQVVLSTFVMSGVLQLLGPWAAEHSFEALVAIVLLTGIVQGGIVLAAHKFFTTWAPPAELGIFTSAIMGTNLGTIVSWSVSGALIETCGWPYSFYFNAVLSGLFVLAWAYVAYDSPAKHPRCPAAERAFIEASLVHSHHSNVSNLRLACQCVCMVKYCVHPWENRRGRRSAVSSRRCRHGVCFCCSSATCGACSSC